MTAYWKCCIWPWLISQRNGLAGDRIGAWFMLSWQYFLLIACRNNLLHTGMSRIKMNGAGAPALDMPTIHCYFENKAAAACATSALNIFCSICTAFRCLHRIWDRPMFLSLGGVLFYCRISAWYCGQIRFHLMDHKQRCVYRLVSIPYHYCLTHEVGCGSP